MNSKIFSVLLTVQQYLPKILLVFNLNLNKLFQNSSVFIKFIIGKRFLHDFFSEDQQNFHTFNIPESSFDLIFNELCWNSYTAFLLFVKCSFLQNLANAK